MRKFFLLAVLAVCMSSCAGSTRSHPCATPDDPVHDTPWKGDVQCSQKKDVHGQYVNNGQYREWYPDGKIALEGSYKMGEKDGRWIQYDEKGRKTSEKLYEDGREIPEVMK